MKNQAAPPKPRFFFAENANRPWGAGIVFQYVDNFGGTVRGVFAAAVPAQAQYLAGLMEKDRSITEISLEEFTRRGGELPAAPVVAEAKAPAEQAGQRITDKPGIVVEGKEAEPEQPKAEAPASVDEVLAKATAADNDWREDGDTPLTDTLAPRPAARKRPAVKKAQSPDA